MWCGSAIVLWVSNWPSVRKDRLLTAYYRTCSIIERAARVRCRRDLSMARYIGPLLCTSRQNVHVLVPCSFRGTHRSSTEDIISEAQPYVEGRSNGTTCCVPVSAPRMFMFHRYFLLLAEVVCPYDPDCFVALGSRVNCFGINIPTTARTS